MNSATDTDSTADTRLRFCWERSNKSFVRTESWQEKEIKRLSNILEYNLENFEIDDKGLQSITKLSAIICEMPMSFVTLVGEDKIKFLSRYGTEHLGTIRQNSFCDLVIEQSNYFEIIDSLKDPRFDENEFVKGQEYPLRFYGAFPLISPKGYHLGSLCVCDIKENKLNEVQKNALKVLTDEVMVHLELRRHNKELKEANERAEKLAKVKDEFMNNVSHELRTPLNAISGYTEILSKTDLDTDQKEAVSIIKSSCEILITLINDILDFSKIQLGKLQLENIPFDLRKTIKNVKDLLNPKAKEKNLKFDLKVDEKIPKFIIGDKVRLNQIIMNLTGNALKFTEEGSVRIDIKQLNETEKNLNIHFSVKDSGIGIQEDKQQSIFERFEQAGKDITRKFGGTGLGLNISKNLVELHNSKLELKSVFGKGTEFYFTILFDKFLDQDDSRNIVNQKVDNNYMEKISNIKELKLLVCEDNSVNIKLIKAIFKNKNINIEIAENGKIAIELLKRKNKKFDIILMDLQMPEMNGYETTKYIRNIMNLNIPIIGFSASTSEIERNYCFEVGMNDYILKTFGGNEIFDRLDKFATAHKIYEEDIENKDNEILNNSSLNKSKRGVSEDVTNKKTGNSLKLYKNRKFKKKNFGQKNINKANNIETCGLRGVGLIKDKNHSNCEKKGMYAINSNSPLTENNSNKNSIDKNDSSNKALNDLNHRSIFSQDVANLKKCNINFSSDLNNGNSSKNSSEKLNKNNFSFNSKKKFTENSGENEMNAHLNEGYNSNTECDFFKKNNNLSLSNIEHNKISKRLLNKKDTDQSAKMDFNELDLNKSFKSESNMDKYNNYLKKCISVGLNKPSSKHNLISTHNNNNYKFSKFNENINNKGSSNNNSRYFSDRNNLENNLNFVADSSNSHLMNNILCDERFENIENENKNENENEKENEDVKKNLEDLKFLDNENNFEIISNSSMTPPKIKQNLTNPKEESPREKEQQAKEEKINNDKNVLSRKSSFAKFKDNESLDFSQVSIRFENFDEYSEKENEDFMEIDNFNEGNFADDFIDDPEMRDELLELFVEENPKQMKSLKSAIIAGNLDAIKFVAHTMRPSVLMFGMRKVYKKLSKIEVICKSISLSKIKHLYEEIKKDLASFFTENKVCIT